jgi:CrcB protein
VGASLGAVLRWGLGAAHNAMFPTVPPGTWLANMLGGYLVGVALAFFGEHAGLAPEWRLLVITGFLGGLTTFSTFSAEVTTLIQQGRLIWAMGGIAAHVIGSLLMTLAGLASWQVLKPP